MTNDPTSVGHWVLDFYGTLHGSGSGILAGHISAFYCWGSMLGNRGLEILIAVSVPRNAKPIWNLGNSEAP
jgi:hypothetical protein